MHCRSLLVLIPRPADVVSPALQAISGQTTPAVGGLTDSMRLSG